MTMKHTPGPRNVSNHTTAPVRERAYRVVLDAPPGPDNALHADLCGAIACLRAELHNDSGMVASFSGLDLESWERAVLVDEILRSLDSGSVDARDALALLNGASSFIGRVPLWKAGEWLEKNWNVLDGCVRRSLASSANSALTEAAPDLLAVASLLLELHDNPSMPDPVTWLGEVVREARAAIAKATGE